MPIGGGTRRMKGWIEGRTVVCLWPIANSIFGKLEKECFRVIHFGGGTAHGCKWIQDLKILYVSLSSCMNHNAKNLDSIGYNRRIPVYSPVHSPPTELAQDRPQGRESKPRNSNVDSRYSLRRAIQERHEDPTEVYTKIQTQLYPQMRF